VSHQFQTSPTSASDVARSLHGLPARLARRVLKPDESITLVRGPRRSPWWEPAVTHPLLFLVALFLGGGCLTVGYQTAESFREMSPIPVMLGAAIVIGSVFVLGFFNGHFTRLVVTNVRLIVLQGSEVCLSKNIDKLPRWLVRRERRDDGEESKTIDVDALSRALGSSDQFVDAKTIQAFSRQLGRFTSGDDTRR
jgi:hypothetical protein